MTILLASKRKQVIYVLKVVHVCPQYTFSLPDSANFYFLVFQNTCPNLTFTCPGHSGKCLCSTLCIHVYFVIMYVSLELYNMCICDNHFDNNSTALLIPKLKANV